MNHESSTVPKIETRIRPSRSRSDRFWILEIDRCPFCEKRHTHGGGSLDRPPLLGSRFSHCVTGSPHEYELVPAEVNP